MNECSKCRDWGKYERHADHRPPKAAAVTPECAWCSAPATEQRHMGTRNVRGTWQRVYA